MAYPTRQVQRFARLMSGMTQEEWGEMLGDVGQHRVSRSESGRHPLAAPGSDVVRRFDRLAALGDRGRGEGQPVYLITLCNDPDARNVRLDFLYDDEGGIGYFADAATAQAVADGLGVMLPNPCAVPCWRAFANELLGDRDEPGRVYHVDEARDGQALKQAIGEWVAGITNDIKRVVAESTEVAAI